MRKPQKMTDSDLFPFLAVFRTLLKVFPRRMDDSDATELGKEYFKALRRFHLDQVQAGSDAWVQRGKFFPKPGEWASVIPRLSPTVGLEPLDRFEMAEYLAADARHFDGDPCGCSLCRAAGVEHRLLRYVPNARPDGREDRGKIGDREVVRGHWAHGEELNRWYAARDRFWLEFGELCDRVTMEQKARHTALAAQAPEPTT